MAHELEMINGQAQMAYRASAGKPWHHLGTPVGDDLTPEEMMIAAGLNWEVSKVPTFITHEGRNIQTGMEALVRSTDGKILTQVGKNWNPVQNAEAFNFFNDFVEAGDMVMDTAGSLKGGEIVWALADVKDGFSLFNGDEVRGYFLFSNPHQYGKCINIRFVLERVVCANTLGVALSEVGQPSVALNHRAVFDAEKVKEMMGISKYKTEKFKQTAEFLGSKQYNREKLEKYFGKIFGTSPIDPSILSRTAEEACVIVETQPGAEFQRGSMWQAFNAVTYMVDHTLGRTADTRMTSAWFGQGAKKKLDALNLAIEMANA